ncbi:terminase small subunit [Gemmobacter sp. 24YEA27]|uniref:terminase small subunit n=1 Tax=Gemmobacter sp. 24YEA27 TaxID=3040672 RepID=UPI0024B3BE05|nr:terminase small subunit [Gemmobacter sp. 24YEA27]
MGEPTESGAVLTPKQEAFALAYFETGNAAEAYRRAYDVAENARDSWVYVEACQLLDHPKITLRLEQLQEQAAKLSIFTRQKALEELEQARSEAIKLGMPAAAVSAINSKVKLFGLDAPTKIKAEVTGKDGGPIRSEEVTARDRIARRIAGIAARTDAPGDTGGAE